VPFPVASKSVSTGRHLLCGALLRWSGEGTSPAWIVPTNESRIHKKTKTYARELRSDYPQTMMNSHERMQRESNLVAIIGEKLPEFAKACADNTELVLIHQDAFAADYQEDEYALLGMAIKYAGLRGKEVRVIGKNRSTLREEEKIQ
jgi:hypothetical protein